MAGTILWEYTSRPSHTCLPQGRPRHTKPEHQRGNREAGGWTSCGMVQMWTSQLQRSRTRHAPLSLLCARWNGPFSEVLNAPIAVHGDAPLFCPCPLFCEHCVLLHICSSLLQVLDPMPPSHTRCVVVMFLSAISDEFYDVYSDAYYDTGTP
jgi:hypothetical protein